MEKRFRATVHKKVYISHTSSEPTVLLSNEKPVEETVEFGILATSLLLTYM